MVCAVLHGFDFIAPTMMAMEETASVFGLGMEVSLKSAVVGS
jgi:hypothetical protein